MPQTHSKEFDFLDEDPEFAPFKEDIIKLIQFAESIQNDKTIHYSSIGDPFEEFLQTLESIAQEKCRKYMEKWKQEAEIQQIENSYRRQTFSAYIELDEIQKRKSLEKKDLDWFNERLENCRKIYYETEEQPFNFWSWLFGRRRRKLALLKEHVDFWKQEYEINNKAIEEKHNPKEKQLEKRIRQLEQVRSNSLNRILNLY